MIIAAAPGRVDVSYGVQGMTEQEDKYDIQFFQIVISLHAGAMQQMGKVSSPITGKVERDLAQAQASIDMLEMLQRKTEGNLNEDEKKLLEHVLFELRMNYVEEAKKGDSADEKPADEKSPEEADSTAGSEPETAPDSASKPDPENTDTTTNTG
jgi:hypothetical protein